MPRPEPKPFSRGATCVSAARRSGVCPFWVILLTDALDFKDAHEFPDALGDDQGLNSTSMDEVDLDDDEGGSGTLA